MNIQAPNNGDQCQDDKGVTPRWWNFFVKVADVLTALTQSGTTAERPTSFLWVGRFYFDTTLGKPIYWKSSGVWVDATGATV
jgi:hypothetical protein